jgi:hypothetical protein
MANIINPSFSRVLLSHPSTTSMSVCSLMFLLTTLKYDGEIWRHFLRSWYEPCPFDGVKRLFSSGELETPAGVLILG